MGLMPMVHVEAFTKRALTAASVVLRVQDNDGQTVANTFLLEGLGAALRQLRCAQTFGDTK